MTRLHPHPMHPCQFVLLSPVFSCYTQILCISSALIVGRRAAETGRAQVADTRLCPSLQPPENRGRVVSAFCYNSSHVPIDL